MVEKARKRFGKKLEGVEVIARAPRRLANLVGLRKNSKGCTTLVDNLVVTVEAGYATMGIHDVKGIGNPPGAQQGIVQEQVWWGRGVGRDR